MKKYPKTLKHKVFNRKRAFKRFKSRQKTKSKLKYRTKEAIFYSEEIERVKGKTDNYILVPEVFSIVDNPEKVIEFITEVRKYAKKGQSVFVDKSRIVKLEYDGILILLTLLVEFKEKGLIFSGSYPKNKKLRRKFRESGFFEILNSTNFQKRDMYEFPYKNKKNILIKSGTKLSPERVSKIISVITNGLFGYERESEGLNNTIGELITNTVDHAGNITKWWVSVDKDPKNVSYDVTIFDHGEGILKTIKKGQKKDFVDNFLQKFKGNQIKGDIELMRYIFDYRNKSSISSTNEDFRGNGLPTTNKNFKSNYYSDLYVISNNIYCDLKNNNFKKTISNLNGTLITFKIFKHNRFED